MTTRKQFLLTVLIGLAVVGGVFLLTWRRLVVCLMARSAAAQLRRSYASKGAPRVQMTPNDWAIEFGGKAGLPHLEALVNDESITQEGRAFAARLRDLIANGAHLPYLRLQIDAIRGRRTDVQPPPWPRRAILEYIYERDSP